MARGVFAGGPRPLAKSRMVVAIVTEDKVDIDRNPQLINEINENLDNPKIGPSFPADSIESLSSEKLTGMFKKGGSENPLEIFNVDWNGVLLTFEFPSFNQHQLERMKDAVDESVDTGVQFYVVGCL